MWVVRKAHSSSHLPPETIQYSLFQETSLVDSRAFLTVCTHHLCLQPRILIPVAQSIFFILWCGISSFLSSTSLVESTALNSLRFEFLSIQFQCLLCPFDSAPHAHYLLSDGRVGRQHGLGGRRHLFIEHSLNTHNSIKCVSYFKMRVLLCYFSKMRTLLFSSFYSGGNKSWFFFFFFT